MTNTRSQRALEAICAREGFDIVAVLPPGDGSLFVARVRDRSGRSLLLKRSSGLRGYAEMRVLQAWNEAGHGLGGLTAVDRRTYVRDWIEGSSLQEGQEFRPVALGLVGGLLRTLHTTRPPARLLPLKARLARWDARRDWAPRLSLAMLDSAGRAAEALSHEGPKHGHLLHGDLVPANVLLTNDGPVLIDPIGFLGPPAWDLAQLAVAVSGRDRIANLADLVAGYGYEPPLLREAFAWMTFMFLDKNLSLEAKRPGTRSRFVSELTPLAASLVRTDG